MTSPVQRSGSGSGSGSESSFIMRPHDLQVNNYLELIVSQQGLPRFLPHIWMERHKKLLSYLHIIWDIDQHNILVMICMYELQCTLQTGTRTATATCFIANRNTVFRAECIVYL